MTRRVVAAPDLAVDLGTCPVCGSPQLQEIRCKVICLNCRTIVQSCADLGDCCQAGPGSSR